MPSCQYEPCGDGAIFHLGVPSAFTTFGEISGLERSAVNAVYQNICCATEPCPGTGPDSEKSIPRAVGGVYLNQSMYFWIA